MKLPTGDDVFLLHSLKKEIESKIMWLESTDAVVSTALHLQLIFISQTEKEVDLQMECL